MFHLLSWLLVYTLILAALGWAVRPVRDRRWFKILLFPGTILASGIQAGCALLSVATACRFSPIRDREPSFELERDRVPCLGGALFVLLTHATLYVLYVILTLQLESAALLEAYPVRLPGLVSSRARLEVGFEEYLGGLGTWLESAGRHPLAALTLLYLTVGSFASLQVSRRETFWALIMFSAAAGATYVGNWFGLGFPFLSRGWWAQHFHYSDWWALFSLFLTLAAFSLALFLPPRLLFLAPRCFGAGSREVPAPRKRARRKRATARA